MKAFGRPTPSQRVAGHDGVVSLAEYDGPMQGFTEIVSTLLKISGRLGFSFAAMALALYVLRLYEVAPFKDIPDSAVHAIALTGLWGAVVAILDAAIAFGSWVSKGVGRKLRSNKEKYDRSIAGLNNLLNGYSEYMDVVAFLYLKRTKRFTGKRNNRLLMQMVSTCILEVDDPPNNSFPRDTFYVVPDHIWEFLAKHEAELKQRKFSISPPWKNHDPDSWLV